MNRGRVAAIGWGIVLVVGTAPAAQTPAPQSAWSGVYSDVQADRGERAYGQACSHCHGLSLEGDGAREIPTLVSDHFQRRWRGKTVQVLFDSLMRSMPADDQGSLTPAGAADLIAYLLRANGARAGDTALPSDRSALAGIVIDEKP
jgi:mono/diheme cytochrome c family protein